MHGAADEDLADDLLREVRERLGERLRTLREERKLSQEVVAKHAGVHQSEWSRVETGKTDPRLSWLLQVQHLFDVDSLETLFGPAPSRQLLDQAKED